MSLSFLAASSSSWYHLLYPVSAPTDSGCSPSPPRVPQYPTVLHSLHVTAMERRFVWRSTSTGTGHGGLLSSAATGWCRRGRSRAPRSSPSCWREGCRGTFKGPLKIGSEGLSKRAQFASLGGWRSHGGTGSLGATLLCLLLELSYVSWQAASKWNCQGTVI